MKENSENFESSVGVNSFMDAYLKPWVEKNKNIPDNQKQSLSDYLNKKDDNGNTVLHRAIINGRFDIAQRLVQTRADDAIENAAGNTPFDLVRPSDKKDASEGFKQFLNRKALEQNSGSIVTPEQNRLDSTRRSSAPMKETSRASEVITAESRANSLSEEAASEATAAQGKRRGLRTFLQILRNPVKAFQEYREARKSSSRSSSGRSSRSANSEIGAESRESFQTRQRSSTVYGSSEIDSGVSQTLSGIQTPSAGRVSEAKLATTPSDVPPSSVIMQDLTKLAGPPPKPPRNPKRGAMKVDSSTVNAIQQEVSEAAKIDEAKDKSSEAKEEQVEENEEMAQMKTSEDAIKFNDEYIDGILEIMQSEQNEFGEIKFDINEFNSDNMTPLEEAVKLGNANGVDRLLAAGADPNRLLNDGSTVLFIAQQKGNDAIIDTLKLYGAEVKMPTEPVKSNVTELRESEIEEQKAIEAEEKAQAELKAQGAVATGDDFMSDVTDTLNRVRNLKVAEVDEEKLDKMSAELDLHNGTNQDRKEKNSPEVQRMEDLLQTLSEDEEKESEVEAEEAESVFDKLNKAIKEGNLTDVRNIIKQGALAQLKEEEKETLIDAAAEKMGTALDNAELADIWVEVQGGAEEVEEESESLEETQEEAVESEMEIKLDEESEADEVHQEEIKFEKSRGEDAVHLAVRQGDIEGLTKLLSKEGLQLPGRKGGGKVSISFDPNTKNYKGQTPLHLAAKQGKMALIEVLLANGANPTLQDKNGKTAYDIAVEKLANNPHNEELDNIGVKLDEAADQWKKDHSEKKSPVTVTKESKTSDKENAHNNALLSERPKGSRLADIKEKLPAPPKPPQSPKTSPPLSRLQQNRSAQVQKPLPTPPTARVEGLKKMVEEKRLSTRPNTLPPESSGGRKSNR